ncbi:MAG: methyl-accepting chemotaxis protein [Acidobacteriota bacterium]
MRWKDFTLKQRMFGGIAIVGALLIVIGFITSYGMQQAQSAYQQAVNTEYKQAIKILEIRLAAANQQAFLTKSILLGTKAEAKQYQEITAEMDSKLEEFNALAKTKEVTTQKLAENIERFRQLSNQANSAIDKGEAELAVKILLDDLTAVNQEQAQMLKQLSLAAVNNAETNIKQAQLTSGDTISLVYLLLICALVAAITVGIIIVYSITNPLKKTISLTQAVADGDLSLVLESNEEKTEVGDLLRAFHNLVDGLKRLTLSIEHISEGDLGVVIKPRSNNDTLALALADMVRSLCSIVLNVRGSSERIKNISLKLANSSQQLERDSDNMVVIVQTMASALEELFVNIKSIASNMDSQASSIAETTATMQQMSTRMQQISNGTLELTGMVDSAREVVQDGQQSVKQTANGMKEINTSLTMTAETIKDLGARAAAIGHILEVINHISDQTNLLALNAAIEAARAGSYGLGFGVVAEEVRKLSERTAKSAEEIAQLISGVQKGVGLATTHMTRSTELVEEGLNQSAKAVGALGQIDTVVGRVAFTTKEIADVIVEQSVATSQVLQSMQHLNLITQEIQAASQEQAASTNELVQSTGNMRTAAERNAELSEQLSSTGRLVLVESQHQETAVSAFRLSDDVLNGVSKDLLYSAEYPSLSENSAKV